jgi:glycosyltransferase involved in cell wall biosynthesis
VPFVSGGAEIHVDSLHRELVARGFEVERITVPFVWPSRRQIVKSALAWRLLDLTPESGRPVDLVIATRFPSYAIRHPNKVVWVIHQLRQVYDQLGTAYSDFRADDPEDRRIMEMVRALDGASLKEARALFTNARNTAERLARFNGIRATALYHPPQHDGRYRSDGYGDYVLGVGRLDPTKRFHQLIRALRHVRSGVRAKIAGSGPERGRLEAMVERHGLRGRVELLGFVPDERLLELYAGCRAVFYAPFDEDYGYVTLEAFKSSKPVVTCSDSGGVLEFVEDGVNGFVCPPERPRRLAAVLDRLYREPETAAALGRRGGEKVAAITWDHAVAALTATLET